MAAQKIKLFIKGEKDDALLALVKRGIKIEQPVQPYTHHPTSREPMSLAIVEPEYLADVVDWLAEDPKMLTGRGYPEGTLLRYVFVGEQASGEVA